ncbi:SGNH/GDSL hydrolase family protein [Paenibacillus sp.]|uniref:SGNH/GDSL hydrolase family protein n=1 Tax=Paenibacillus sp. TaxID=58172 RepID=UPI002D2F6BA8|nr:SGNH/GDSL hydrolase family protein [Paenibacillus sp.]HZG85062.1 SGNH/GDSL hydrolase family protein [Paenibacillus sp.]
MIIGNDEKLLMIGDSITDCERARPIGESRFGGGTGKGYVAQVEALLHTRYPERNIRVVNMGISGNTVRDLKARWQTDVVELKPDWLSIMIGINDVWRQFDSPTIPEAHVYIEEYEATLDELVAATKPTVKGIVLMTPFYIEPNREDAMRATMDQYGAVVQQLAAKHGARFVDTQAAFDRVMRHLYPATLAWDRVHPVLSGHMTIAKAFLDEIGFEWD